MKETLSDPYTALRWANWLGRSGIAVMLLGCTISDSLSPVLFWALIAAGVLLLAGSVAVERLICRCPYCSSHLGWFRRGPYSLHLPERCPRCGHLL